MITFIHSDAQIHWSSYIIILIYGVATIQGDHLTSGTFAVMRTSLFSSALFTLCCSRRTWGAKDHHHGDHDHHYQNHMHLYMTENPVELSPKSFWRIYNFRFLNSNCFFSFWQTKEKSANLRFIDCFMRQILVLLKYTKNKTLGKLENQKEYCQNLEELTVTFDFLTERQSWRKKTALVDFWLGSNCLKLIASDNWRQI